MKNRMPNELRTITRPIMAKVSILLAPSTFLGSPPDVTKLIPE